MPKIAKIEQSPATPALKNEAPIFDANVDVFRNVRDAKEAMKSKQVMTTKNLPNSPSCNAQVGAGVGSKVMELFIQESSYSLVLHWAGGFLQKSTPADQADSCDVREVYFSNSAFLALARSCSMTFSFSLNDVVNDREAEIAGASIASMLMFAIVSKCRA